MRSAATIQGEEWTRISTSSRRLSSRMWCRTSSSSLQAFSLLRRKVLSTVGSVSNQRAFLTSKAPSAVHTLPLCAR